MSPRQPELPTWNDRAEFWQREAARYDSASRALMGRVRAEIALGITGLSSIVALVVANHVYVFLVGVPILAATVWGMVLWSVQESFLLDAHLMYAETHIDRALGDPVGGRGYPVWAHHGGRVGRFGYTLRLMYGAWALATLVILGSCIYFAISRTDDFWLMYLLIWEVGWFLLAVGVGARKVNDAGSILFARFRELLGIGEGG